MMGHVWRHDGDVFVAAKGSPERILTLCALTEAEQAAVRAQLSALSAQGLRVIAVGRMALTDETEIPAALTDCRLDFCGLVGLSDPPRAGVRENIETCRRAGIRVVMITGDNGETAAAIARRVGIAENGHIITGDMLEAMSDEELCGAVRHTSIFSRVIPEHKMRIVRAFRENGEIVAMTGDGANDAPALKYADIGIAMGGRGSEVAREASDLILMDDNFSTIVDTVRDGRRIYDNIRRAIGYVFTIHIPIALSSLLAPMLGIPPEGLLMLPILVVLLELIIDPTCAVVLERQPAERNIMARPPRDPGEKLVDRRLFFKSILQGLVVFAAFFGSYYLCWRTTGDARTARSLGLAVIMFVNIFLVQVNSSSSDFMITSLRQLIRDKIMWAANLFTLALLAVVIYSPVNSYLKLAPLSPVLLLSALGIAAASVLWYELVKLIRRKNE